MKQILWTGVLSLGLVACGQEPQTQAPSEPDTTAQVSQPATPLLGREVFFGNSQVAFGTLSPNGELFAFSRELDGIPNIWVNGLDAPLDQRLDRLDELGRRAESILRLAGHESLEDRIDLRGKVGRDLRRGERIGVRNTANRAWSSTSSGGSGLLYSRKITSRAVLKAWTNPL